MAAPFARSEDLPSQQDTATKAQMALAQATDMIRAALGGQQITKVTGDTVTLAGNGRRILQLPQIPVTAVTSVTINLGGAYPNQLTPDVHYTWDGATGLLTALAYPWPRDWDVTVVYSHGYDTVPDDLIRLCASVADKILAGTVGVKAVQESIGTKQSSITYITPTTRSSSGGGARASSGVVLFNDAEELILDQYRLDLTP